MTELQQMEMEELAFWFTEAGRMIEEDEAAREAASEGR
jgi:hypothetical protein